MTIIAKRGPTRYPLQKTLVTEPWDDELCALMSAPEFDVRYAAQLARLNLTEEEIAKFQAQLSQVLDYVERLKKVDVSHVEPTAHTHPVFNVFRPDESRDWFDAEEALANAPRKANNLFIVTKVVE